MIHSQIEIPTHGYSRNEDDKSGRCEPTFPRRAPARAGNLNVPAALVLSSDEYVLQELAEIIVQCRMAVFVAFTIHEGKRILERQRVSVVVCDDRLSDGKYEDILTETVQLHLKTPVIVVSPTGDWSDYLKAISAGAFDYLAYPPIPGDLPRTVREALTPQTECTLQDTTGKLFYLL
jgi:DNA-binding NtrC family response regulator